MRALHKLWILVSRLIRLSASCSSMHTLMSCTRFPLCQRYVQHCATCITHIITLPSGSVATAYTGHERSAYESSICTYCYGAGSCSCPCCHEIVLSCIIVDLRDALVSISLLHQKTSDWMFRWCQIRSGCGRQTHNVSDIRRQSCMTRFQHSKFID